MFRTGSSFLAVEAEAARRGRDGEVFSRFLRGLLPWALEGAAWWLHGDSTSLDLMVRFEGTSLSGSSECSTRVSRHWEMVAEDTEWQLDDDIVGPFQYAFVFFLLSCPVVSLQKPHS